MMIGLDFDNTLVCHDDAFHRIARERGWVPANLQPSKNGVRDHLRSVGREELWTELQGVVYGSRLHEAPPFPGALNFVARCRSEGVRVCIVSHRTRAPIMGPAYDLHLAARNWLSDHEFLHPNRGGIAVEDVHLETTKEAKLERIAALGCSHFVDDLAEFLGEAHFPERVARILFDPHGRSDGSARITRAGSWSEIEGTLFGAGKAAQPSAEAIRALLAKVGAPVEFDLQALAGGVNNRVFRVQAGDFEAVLKAYFTHPDDSRDRLRAEYSFCRFAWENGIRYGPQPFACDSIGRLALYEWIRGEALRPGQIGPAEVADAIDFYGALNACRERGSDLPRAAEACFSLSEHLATVEGRVRRLEALDPQDEASAFVLGELRPAWETRRQACLRRASEVGHAVDSALLEPERRLSPSDFGFHNAIRTPDGRLRFIDFEYAGWDDPAKTACDFSFQPAVPVPQSLCEEFTRAAFAGSSNAAQHRMRVALLDGAYRIKWCCILLNEFLPAGGARRRFAGALVDPLERRAEQLRKARALLQSEPAR